MKIFQVYFEDSQKEKLDYIPYKNDVCSVFFENKVILELKKAGQITDDFGVVSHKLKEKIGVLQKVKWRGSIANKSNRDFTPELFEELYYLNSPDAMSFQRHEPHDPISYADKFHPKFSAYFKNIMNEIGYDWKPTHFEDVFYCNFFVAKPEVYLAYINEMLCPAMQVMECMPELMGNSHYPNALPDNLKKTFGINHYPYHPFLCERMFSYFAHINKLKCVHF